MPEIRKTYVEKTSILKKNKNNFVFSGKYNFSPYDSIHIQCALEQDCKYFLSEDMRDGLIINKKLTILNQEFLHPLKPPLKEK